MKRTLLFLFSCIALLSIPVHSDEQKTQEILDMTKKAGYTFDPKNAPKSSIIVDGTDGQILWEQNPDLVRNPASIAKMMTVYLVFDAMKEGKFNLDTTVTATPEHVKISKIYAISNNNIVAGVAYPVRELLTMTIVPSSNVTTIMLANLVSDGDEGLFIRKMNEKAQQLGMNHSKFFNASGASANSFEGLYTPEGFDPNASNQTTARDLATMTFNLIKDHPDVLQFTSKGTATTMAGTPYEEQFEGYNYSLPGLKYGLEGVDGLKTGSGPEAAFNYIATAKRQDLRLIEVVLGVGDWADQDGEYYRHTFGNALLENAFNTYEERELLPAGTHEIDGQTIVTQTPLRGVIAKDKQPEFHLENQEVVMTNIAPQLANMHEKIAVPFETAKQTTTEKVLPVEITPDYEKYVPSIIISVAGILLTLIGCCFPNRVRKTKRTICIFGLLVATAGVGYFLVTLFNLI